MSVRKFIGASSTLLLVWLGATYFHQVSPDKYKVQGRLKAETTSTTIKSHNPAIVSVDSSAKR